MIATTIQRLLERDLEKLQEELRAYPEESMIWATQGAINNSAGNLALHLIGNLQFYIGTTLGNTGYIRNRPAEFGDKDVPREQLLRQIDETLVIIRQVLPGISSEDLGKTYPEGVRPQPVTTEFWLMHLATHLTYHLGQINYHRRLCNPA